MPGSCSTFKAKIVQQMKDWEGPGLCPNTTNPDCPKLPCGQNCLYELISVEEGKLVGTHTTPLARYVDDLYFEFSEEGSNCEILGFSSARTWYAVLDFGTNYCNLRNLLDGSGLSNHQDFKEETSDAMCTQYTSRDCSRF